MLARVLVGLTAVAFLAACTSSSTADPTPSTSVTTTSATPTTSTPTSSTATLPTSSPTKTTPPTIKTTGPGVKPGEKPPVLPAIAKTHTREGATFFAVHYFRALDWAIATNDPAPLSGLAAPSCKTCAGFVSTITKLETAGNHTRAGRILVLSFGPTTGHSEVPADRFVEVQIQQQAGSVVSSTGRELSKVPSGKKAAIVALRWTESGWTIVGLGQR